MYANQITADMAAAHRRDLTAAAAAHRLTRQARRSVAPSVTPTRPHASAAGLAAVDAPCTAHLFLVRRSTDDHHCRR